MPLFTPLIIPEGGALYSVDNSGNISKILYVNSNGYVDFMCNTSNAFQFSNNADGALFYVDGDGLALQMGPDVVVSFSTGPGPTLVDTILSVDNTSGNTILGMHRKNNQLHIQNQAGTDVVVVDGTNKVLTANCGEISARTAVSANYTILVSDYIVAYTSTSSAFTATLPAAASSNAGQQWIIKDESGGAATHNITVKTNGGTIDGTSGSTGKIINTNYGVLRVYSNGSNYFTL